MFPNNWAAADGFIILQHSRSGVEVDRANKREWNV
jgi:hypothetical protein